jgi:hypothetical protein
MVDLRDRGVMVRVNHGMGAFEVQTSAFLIRNS